MAKKVIIGIGILGLIALIGLGVSFANFNLFEEPAPSIIKAECDYDGLRKVTMYELEGNATANNSIHIVASDCNYESDLKDAESIFIASSSRMTPEDISFEWKSFDTLEIRYKKHFEIFEQKAKTESLKPEVIFKYIGE